jgi:hypothetical protein
MTRGDIFKWKRVSRDVTDHRRTQGSWIIVELKHTYVMSNKNTPAIPMIEQLIQCASNYDKTITFMLIAHNGTEYDHFHLFKDLAQFEKTTEYEIKYNKIRKEGIKTHYVEVTFIYNSQGWDTPTPKATFSANGARIMVLRLIDSHKFITCTLVEFPHNVSVSHNVCRNTLLWMVDVLDKRY